MDRKVESGINRTTRFALSAVLLVGLLLSFYTGNLVYQSEEKATLTAFQKEVDQHTDVFYRKLNVNLETLHSLTILFHNNQLPQLSQFQQVARKILKRHDDIQALEWIPRVPHSERQTVTEQLAQEIPGFEFTEREAQGVMIKAQTREIYFPVYYIEPLLGNEAALGFDLGSSSKRNKTLTSSLQSGFPSATESITLVQEQAAQKGFLAMIPIYKGLNSTQQGREENFRGFILGVFRVGDIFKNAVINNELDEINMLLKDVTHTEKPDVLYHHNSLDEALYDGYTYTKQLPLVWGRQWEVVATPSIKYMAIKRTSLPLIVVTLGGTFTAFIFLYILIISRQNALIQKTVIEKTYALNQANRELEIISRSDGLTGLANRRYLDEFLKKEWDRAIRNQTPISFIFVDVDFFKDFNDTYGHLMGDECLRRIADTLQEIARRPGDLVARYGGEEFAIVLAETQRCQEVAEACRTTIEQLKIPHTTSDISKFVTISLGTCTRHPSIGSSVDQMIQAADRALYLAKESGRNQTQNCPTGVKLAESI